MIELGAGAVLLLLYILVLKELSSIHQTVKQLSISIDTIRVTQEEANKQRHLGLAYLYSIAREGLVASGPPPEK
jgi:hypothetical protein